MVRNAERIGDLLMTASLEDGMMDSAPGLRSSTSTLSPESGVVWESNLPRQRQGRGSIEGMGSSRW